MRTYRERASHEQARAPIGGGGGLDAVVADVFHLVAEVIRGERLGAHSQNPLGKKRPRIRPLPVTRQCVRSEQFNPKANGGQRLVENSER